MLDRSLLTAMVLVFQLRTHVLGFICLVHMGNREAALGLVETMAGAGRESAKGRTTRIGR